MLLTLRNAWKVPELKKRFLWTIFLVAIFRIGIHLPVPGIGTEYLSGLIESDSLLGFYNLISGGAFSNFSIFALSVTPYINASIIMQLLTIAIPSLEQLSKEGEDGKKKIQSITRILSIAIGCILAFGTYSMIRGTGATAGFTAIQVLVLIVTLVVGSTFCMWLGDQITVKGFGNGISILIFVNIISQLPKTAKTLAVGKQSGEIGIIEIALFLIFVAALLFIAVFFSLAERRIPVQYAGKAVGNKVARAQTTHIPLSIIGSAVIAIIFAMSVMMFPQTIATIFPDKEWAMAITGSKYSIFNKNSWMYPVCYSIFTVFFTWFYTQITFKPDEMAENLHKSAGFIPGIRPGEATEKFFERVLTRVSLIGGLFAAFLAITPILIENYTALKGISFGGTSLLIIVGVAMDFSRQLDSQLVMRHYKGFLK
ncbi:preprotein translocase subunit SecY [Clostridium gasigenes]|uniref:Protein translocase subunit SecY n=1 Tax=Clostridium gasigenes TaxID=94869 RepID=A0A1H0SJH2_9CLOT|nr:preprotein translocase subunit SecY [Clostridium gasigenes]MBB6624982.1 preprotein translocase subunit SecY [Clostridium gasigenes]MBB6715445.1 preprotein translocase subunit SecY [Clostridium gasigenes]MBU3088994.1 preprotein translocase subunit SecY [Clostridium gasigenes]MBU3104847.1 preprotein translocase subunit SecY [Clostridium gasigenes]MBU3108639.1 preprotein translocase subunit SecY [Clostridium gasigenes]